MDLPGEEWMTILVRLRSWTSRRLRPRLRPQPKRSLPPDPDCFGLRLGYLPERCYLQRSKDIESEYSRGRFNQIVKAQLECQSVP